MKKAKHLLPLALLLASAPMMQSCLDDDDNNSYVICPSTRLFHLKMLGIFKVHD
ncbi:hypothetical protein [Duncaniella muris]|uniref:hypothetical protein n=1 Tax=Duncaniella muris TaxID=2094150 RepID=UPI0027146898|nr:hypothetical protein [Duncaniella muris]